MTTLLIRNVDPALHARLKARAASHGRSMEEEVRTILRESVGAGESEAANWVGAIRALFEPLGGAELPIPSRGASRDPPRFDELNTPLKRGGRRRPHR